MTATTYDTNETSMGSTAQLARMAIGFLETFRESFLALTSDLGGLLAGSMLVMLSDVFSLASWVLIIYPSILSMRGVIGGLFSGRLTTGLHLGTIRPSFINNTRDFRILNDAATALTLQSSLMMAALASFLSVLYQKIPLTDTICIFSVITTTMGLSLLFVSPATLGVSILAFRRGLDPDIIVYPAISTFADILVTACFILTLKVVFSFGPLGLCMTGMFDIAFFLVVVYLLVRYRREKEFVKTIREFSFALVVVTIIVNVTGNILGRISHVVGRIPEIFMLYPALIDAIGDVGSIVGSIATTKLSLGTVDSSFRSIRKGMPEIGGASLSPAIWFILYSFIAFCSVHGAALSYELPWLIAVLLSLNLLAAPAIAAFAYAVAIVTYRRGLDPDNFVIPFESSLADSVTTTCLFIVVSFLGGL